MQSSSEHAMTCLVQKTHRQPAADARSRVRDAGAGKACFPVRWLLMSVLAVVASLPYGCSKAVEPLPELPKLAEPIPPPPEPPPEPEVATIELSAVDLDGQEITQLATDQDFQADVEFKLSEGSPPVERVRAVLGLYLEPENFAIAWSKTVVAKPDGSGLYHVTAPLHAAPHPGTFHLRIEANKGTVLAERKIEITEVD